MGTVLILAADEEATQVATLERHLKPAVRARRFEVKTSANGTPGSHRSALQGLAEGSDLVVALLSPAFVSDDAWIALVVAAMAAKRRVVPVLVRPCLWRDTPLAPIHCLPRDGRALLSSADPDSAWVEVARELVQVFGPPSSGVTPAMPPSSVPPESEIHSLEHKLNAARAKRKNLERVGTPAEAIAAVDAEIVDLRRKLRARGQLSAGETLGNYVLVSLLGKGGFATVWRARAEQTSTDVAIKVLHLQFAQDVERRERFFRGARVMHSLDHPNIVRVLVPEGHDRGFDYFVMELVPGGTLREAVLQGRLQQRRIPEVLLRLCEALGAAHAAGHVHRDVKPANILLDEHGNPKLADFDLVGGANTTGGTRTGAMGTFVYAAPEAMERPQDTDRRADIYSLGMTAVFCWHRAELPPAQVMRNLVGLIRSLACDEWMKRLLARATEWEVSDRFADATELRYALEVTACEEPWAIEQGEDGWGAYASFQVGTVIQRMRWVPPGTFLMGSPTDEEGRWEAEGPQHEVTISWGFWLAETPCTQALWEAVMGNNPSRFKSPERPVEQVSWNDCQLFVQKLNGLIPGLDVRLPTEAEWEYACRAGTKQATWVGNLDINGECNAPILDDIAWYGGNSHGFDLKEGWDSSSWPDKQYPHTKAGTWPVGLKKPNPWGLHDMLGNVLEWCSDWWGSYSAASIVDPTGSVMGSWRVCRGGSWLSLARRVRAADRGALTPDGRGVYLGFRLARGQTSK